METMLLERDTPIDTLFSFIGVERVVVSKDAGTITLTPAENNDEPEEYDTDPADYPDTTAYLTAIPGAVERLVKSMNIPLSELEEWPRPVKKTNV
jgi:hypothetical protein